MVFMAMAEVILKLIAHLEIAAILMLVAEIRATVVVRAVARVVTKMIKAEAIVTSQRYGRGCLFKYLFEVLKNIF